jgi:vanillate O-demethylase monooxygenase subunit
MYLDIQFSFAASPGQNEVPQPSTHILTPQCEHSTHYFWASGVLRDAQMTDEEHKEGLRFAFDEEDAPMLEAVETMMAGREFWAMRPAILSFDQGSVRARRILRKKIAAETKDSASQTINEGGSCDAL